LHSNSTASKSELRSALLQQIKNASTAEKQSWSKHLQENLKDFLADQQGYWGAYHAISDEPMIEWEQVSNQIQWCYPRVQNDLLQFQFGASRTERSAFGVQEPVDGQAIRLDQLTGVIVPGVAFSQTGHRLGRGQGYYDRNLAFYTGKKVGICFDLTYRRELPSESHDILFNHVVTESSVHAVKNPEGEKKWN
jgi:5-formyltetrahydrofolate cyclo-ligase